MKGAAPAPSGLSVTAGAKVLGVTRQTLTKVVNGMSGIAVDFFGLKATAGASTFDL
jgi:plasmid maintenance system antidote protein VapI